MRNEKGLFITFEGSEGAGKSTQVELLCDVFESKKIPYIKTREPGGTVFAEKIRAILKDTDLNNILSLRTEALLFQAARAQHVYEKIKPALNSGKVVVCDRYADSSVVYQGIARGLGKKEIEALNSFSTCNLVPDLTILLDIDPELGLERADFRESGSVKKDRFEEQGIDFHLLVRKSFLELAKENSKRYRIVPADRDARIIHNHITALMHDEFGIF